MNLLLKYSLTLGFSRRRPAAFISRSWKLSTPRSRLASSYTSLAANITRSTSSYRFSSQASASGLATDSRNPSQRATSAFASSLVNAPFFIHSFWTCFAPWLKRDITSMKRAGRLNSSAG